jgi:hypothetical protein
MNDGYEMKITIKVPAGSKIDLGDCFFNLASYITDCRNEGVTFRQEYRGDGEDWKLYDTEESFAINCEGKFAAHFEGETLVKTPAVQFPTVEMDGDAIR